ncbi:hypothetical protein ACQ4PT_031843 [Festuca glaucescens]
MAIAMISPRSRPLSLSAHSSRIRTSHVPTRACSTALPSPRILRARYAVHPAPRALLVTRLLLLPPSSSNGRNISGSDSKLPLGGGGCGGGGGGGVGSRSGKPGSGDEDDSSGEGFRVLNCIVKYLRRLLQLGVLKEPLLAGDFLATMHSWISLNTEVCGKKNTGSVEMECLSSSHSSNSLHEIRLMGNEESHCDVSSNDQLKVIMPVPWDNHSGKSRRTSSKKNKYSTRTAEVGTRTTNSQDDHGDMDTSDDETPPDENEKKMKGRRGYVFTMAASSLAWAGGLFPYWGICCSDKTLSIPNIWKDALHMGYIFLIITIVILTAHSSRFKDGKLADNAGFKLLEIVQLVVLLCLCAATFIPQHVCRGMSNLVVWPSAVGAFFIIVIPWAVVFQKKTVIKCIKDPCEMGIKCTKVMYTNFWQWLTDLSLPECISAKFREMPEQQSYPGVAMEPV